MVTLAYYRPPLRTGYKLQLTSFVLAITVASCLGFNRFGPIGLEKNTKHSLHDFHSAFAQPANDIESLINLRSQQKPSKLGIRVSLNDNNAKVENEFSEFGEQKKFKRMGLDNFNLDAFPQYNNQKSKLFQQPEKGTVNIAEEPNQEENAIDNQRGNAPQATSLKESDSVNQGKEVYNNQELGHDVSLFEKVGRAGYGGLNNPISSLNVLFHTLDTLRPETNKNVESSLQNAANLPKQEKLQVFQKVPNNVLVNELTQQILRSKSFVEDNPIDEIGDSYNKQDSGNQPKPNYRRKILFPRSKKRTAITYQGKIVPIKHSSPSYPKLYHTHNLPLSKYGLDDTATLAESISNSYNSIPGVHNTGSHLTKSLNGIEENMGVGKNLESTSYFDEFSKLGQNNGQNLQKQITHVLGNIKSLVMGAQNEADANTGFKNFAELNDLEEIQNGE